MRALITIAGVNAAVAGLAVAGHQATEWFQDGYWPTIPFRNLWLALGGAVPDVRSLHGFEGLIAQLLEEPLSLVLVIGGVSIAWAAAERQIRPWTRI
jgi:hypothetical protein